MADKVLRIVAMGDLHCSKISHGAFQHLFQQATHDSDVLLLCGDLTDNGLPEEAEILAKEVATVQIPIVAVLGNHDYEGSDEKEIMNILGDAGIHILDGEAIEIQDVGFAGTKGFIGGFGRWALGPWGERIIKDFVKTAIDEALKLETALAKLSTVQRIVLLHYSPIEATVEGEARESYAFLGSSRLEEPIHRYPVSMIFHGHAHKGRVVGFTSQGVPVYNVSVPLLRRVAPHQPPFYKVELPLGCGGNTVAEEPPPMGDEPSATDELVEEYAESDD